MAGQRYYVKRGKKTVGPLTGKQVGDAIRSQKFKGNDSVGTSEDGYFTKLGSVYRDVIKGKWSGVPIAVLVEEEPQGEDDGWLDDLTEGVDELAELPPIQPRMKPKAEPKPAKEKKPKKLKPALEDGAPVFFLGLAGLAAAVIGYAILWTYGKAYLVLPGLVEGRMVGGAIAAGVGLVLLVAGWWSGVSYYRRCAADSFEPGEFGRLGRTTAKWSTFAWFLALSVSIGLAGRFRIGIERNARLQAEADEAIKNGDFAAAERAFLAQDMGVESHQVVEKPDPFAKPSATKPRSLTATTEPQRAKAAPNLVALKEGAELWRSDAEDFFRQGHLCDLGKTKVWSPNRKKLAEFSNQWWLKGVQNPGSSAVIEAEVMVGFTEAAVMQAFADWTVELSDVSTKAVTLDCTYRIRLVENIWPVEKDSRKMETIKKRAVGFEDTVELRIPVEVVDGRWQVNKREAAKVMTLHMATPGGHEKKGGDMVLPAIDASLRDFDSRDAFVIGFDSREDREEFSVLCMLMAVGKIELPNEKFAQHVELRRLMIGAVEEPARKQTLVAASSRKPASRRQSAKLPTSKSNRRPANKQQALTDFQRANGITHDMAQAAIIEWAMSHNMNTDWDLEDVKRICLKNKRSGSP